MPRRARTAHIVPNLAGLSLLSICQLCDAGCEIHFNATTITVRYDYEVVFTGNCSPTTRLWLKDVSNTPSTSPLEHCYVATGTSTPADFSAHAALLSPTLSTLERAAHRGYLTNFPGLTMVKGHLGQTRQNQHSTKATELDDVRHDFVPKPEHTWCEPIIATWLQSKPVVKYFLNNRAVSSSCPAMGINTCWFYMITTVTQFLLTQ